MAIKVTTGPVLEPVTYNQMKDHLRIYHNDEQALIEGYIKAARQYCEEAQNRAYIEQTILYTLDRWPSERRILLPRAPLLDVLSIEYTDAQGNVATLDPTTYTIDVDVEPGMVVLNTGETWPSVRLYPYNAIKIAYEAGYGDDPADVPETIKQAIKFIVAHFYENREEVAGRGHIPQILPLAAKHLLNMDPVSWTEEFNR